MQHSELDAIESAVVAGGMPRRQLVPFVAYQLLTTAQFTSTIWILWLAHRGFSLAEIGIAESCYHIGRLALNVPTGAFADAWGRKWSMAISSVVVLVSTSLIWWSPGFVVICAALALDGAAATFRIGADQAYLFDALAREQQSRRFARMLGNILAASWVAAAVIGWIGAWLSDWSYAWPFGLTFGAAVVSLGLAIALPEAGRGTAHRSATGMIRLIHDGARVIAVRRVLLQLVLFSSGVWAASTLSNLYLQKVLQERGFSNGSVGFAIGATSIVSAGAVWVGGRLSPAWRRWGPFAALAALLAVTISLQGSAVIVVVIVGMTLREVVVGLFEPLIATWVNDETPADVRATVLSLQEMGFSIVMIPAFPLLGALADRSGWFVGYSAVSAALIILITAVLLLGTRKSGVKKE